MEEYIVDKYIVLGVFIYYMYIYVVFFISVGKSVVYEDFVAGKVGGNFII